MTGCIELVVNSELSISPCVACRIIYFLGSLQSIASNFGKEMAKRRNLIDRELECLLVE